MENGGLSGEYGLVGLICVFLALGGLVSLAVYGALKLGLKNPDDIP
jgi:hypothetical protein